MDGLSRISELLDLSRVLCAVVFAVILAFGLFRGRRDTYFVISVVLLVGYLLMVGMRFYAVYEKNAWINEADAERAVLEQAETWAFDPTEINSIHLDWPLRKSNDGRLRMNSVLGPLGRIWQLADPENDGFLEVGRDPVYRAKVLVGDPRCFSNAPDLLRVSELTGEDRLARGICVAVEPVESSEAEFRVTYELKHSRRGQGGDSRAELRLETKNDGLIDLIVTASGAGTGRSFFFPTTSDGPFRSIDNYLDGPIVALRDWFADTGNSDENRAGRSQWLLELARRAGLTDALLLEGLANGTHRLLRFRALALACTKWDMATPELRAAITAMLARELANRPRAGYMRDCGRRSCTTDSIGLGERKDCQTPPPQIVLPKLD